MNSSTLLAANKAFIVQSTAAPAKAMRMVIDSNDIICTSPGDPSPMNLFDEEVDDSQQGSTSSDIWGKQW